MEETNYSRAIIVGHEAGTKTPEEPPAFPAEEYEKSGASIPAVEQAEASVPMAKKQKTYFEKLKLWQSTDAHKPNHLGSMVARPLIFLTFPVIFYAGFSYGSNLVW